MESSLVSYRAPNTRWRRLGLHAPNASITSSAPSHAAKERETLLGEVDTAVWAYRLFGSGVLLVSSPGTRMRNRLELDGDAALLLQIHGVEQLFRHITVSDGPGFPPADDREGQTSCGR